MVVVIVTVCGVVIDGGEVMVRGVVIDGGDGCGVVTDGNCLT